jgi:hypothetical protein
MNLTSWAKSTLPLLSLDSSSGLAAGSIRLGFRFLSVALGGLEPNLRYGNLTRYFPAD